MENNSLGFIFRVCSAINFIKNSFFVYFAKKLKNNFKILNNKLLHRNPYIHISIYPYIFFHNPNTMDFHGEKDYKIIMIDILLNDLQNRKEFDAKMTMLEDSIDTLREIVEKEPEKMMILFNEIIGSIL